MKLSEIEEMVRADSELDQSRLDFEVLRIPQLHAKYYRIFMEEVRVLKEIQFETSVVRKKKTDYYLGRATDAEYKEKPLDVKVLKTDLDLYLAADEDLQKLERNAAMQKLKTEMLEKFISTLKERSFSIKTALDFMKFKNGDY